MSRPDCWRPTLNLTDRNRKQKEEDQYEESRSKLSREYRKCSYACAEKILKRPKRGKAPKQTEKRIRSSSSSDNEASREEGKAEKGRGEADRFLAALSSMTCFAAGLECDGPKGDLPHTSSGCRRSESQYDNASSGAEEREDDESSIPASQIDVSLFYVRERHAL